MLALAFKSYSVMDVRLKESNMSTEKTTVSARSACKVGWHGLPAKDQPKTGKGSFTVEPIRDPKEITRIKAALADKPRDFSLFMVGIHVGLRGSDLLSLTWSDVCEDDGKIRNRLKVTESKTGKTRNIAMQPKVREALDNWRKRAGDAVTGAGFVWPARNGGKLTIQRLHQLVNEWCGAADVRGHFGTHTLRKTYGYHLRRSGTDIALIMDIFSHSSGAITLRYVGLEQDDFDEANLKLSL